MLTTTAKQCYIIDVDSEKANDYLDIQFVPRQLFFERNVKMEGVNIIGRNLPSYQYLGGESTVAMTLDFFANENSRRDVMRSCKWLESLTYNEALDEPPHRVIITFGKLFRNEYWVVKSCSYRVDNFNKVKGFLPQQAYVDLVFGRWAEKQVSASEIRQSWEAVEEDDVVTQSLSQMLAESRTINDAGSQQPNTFNLGDYRPLANDVENLDENRTARQKINESRKSKIFRKATVAFEFAKLGGALIQSFT